MDLSMIFSQSWLNVKKVAIIIQIMAAIETIITIEAFKKSATIGMILHKAIKQTYHIHWDSPKELVGELKKAVERIRATNPSSFGYAAHQISMALMTISKSLSQTGKAKA